MRKAAIFILAGVLAAVLPLGAQMTASFEQPVLITSAGQSADAQLASVLAKKAGLQSDLVKMAAANDLAGHKTLVLVLGASMKGLGAAGLDTAKEKDRIQGLLAAAKAQSIPVLCLHLGGEARRGELTDAMVTEYLPSARAVLVVKSGDKDGLFSRLCADKKIPLILVDKTLDAVAPLKAAFVQ